MVKENTVPKSPRSKKKSQVASKSSLPKPALVGVGVVAVVAVAVLALLTGRTLGGPSVDGGGGIPVSGNIKGVSTAPVTLVEYSDFQCPFCARFFRETAPLIERDYVKTGKVKLEYRNVAFIGEESALASRAAECALEQGKFWDYHDKLFQNQKGENKGAFARENLIRFAHDIGLDTGKFTSCLDSGRYADKVASTTKQMHDDGITSTPSFLINGTLVKGAQPYADFQKIIEEKLKAKQ
jgi:protein-disulfide isomerase